MPTAKQYTDLTEGDIKAALKFIDPNREREAWARIGMALKSELGEPGFELFEGWSQTGQGYNARDCKDTWKSIRPLGGVNIGSLIYEAQQAGFQLNDNERQTLTVEQIEERRKRREADAAKAEAELRHAQSDAAKMANATWEASRPANEGHPYLEDKGVTAHGLAIGEWPLLNEAGEVFRRIAGALLVPIADAKNGKIISLQGIFLGPDGDIQKRYLKNGRKKGGFHMIGNPPGAGEPLAFCEGYATGATIHQVTGWPVIVTFDAPNLPVVVEIMREQFPQAAFLICADNDQWTKAGDIENPGVHYATKAAQANRGCLLIPKFQDVSTRPTDWNDLAALEGNEVAAGQLLDNPVTKPPTVPAAANDNALGAVDYYTPLVDFNSKGKPRPTLENVKEICRRLGVVVRYNTMTKDEEILIPGKAFLVDNRLNAAFYTIASECAKFDMPRENLDGFLTTIANENPYNPVATWITSKPWDGVPRLHALCDTVVPVDEKPLADGRKLSDVLIRRWMLSAVAAAFEPAGVSAHGVLVFQGAQNLGKTMWFKRLAPAEYLQDGMLLRPDDRDSVKQVCSFWLVELGELDATFRKSDLAALKAFITRGKDVLRRSHARKESEYARRTVFFGSVNPREFLHDPTGNRRYWAIECKEIDYLHDLDMQQVWAEVLALYQAGERHYLAPDEMATLNECNEQFTAIDPIEERLQTRLAWNSTLERWDWRTATEILLAVGVDRPTQADATKAASVIRKLNGGRSRRSNGKKMLLCPPTVHEVESDRAF